MSIENIIISLLLFFGTLYVIYFYYIYIYKPTKRIIKNPKKLLTISPLGLASTIKKIKTMRGLDEIVTRLRIDKEQIDFVINFISNGFTDKNIEYFSLKSKLKIELVKGVNSLYKITIEKDFALNFQSFYLYINSDTNDLSLNIDKMKEKLTIVISYSKVQQEQVIDLKNTSSFAYNKIINPSLEEIMKLLLAKDYIKALENIFAKYVEPKYLSPLNSKLMKYKYIDREKLDIVYELNQELKNLFVIGSRDSSKTYLLDLISENFKSDNNINVIRLNKKEIDELIKYISEKIKGLNNKKKIIFLIHNIDDLIKDESFHELLNYFKKINTEKNIFFIMTGFWELYQELNIKEKFPLQNFSNIKEISDRLDSETTMKMIEESMSFINIKCEREVLKTIIDNSGGKLTLINLICQEVLQKLRIKGVIDNRDLEPILTSSNVLNEIRRLNNFDSGLERIILYLVVDKDKFTLKELVNDLDEYGINSTINDIKYCLRKLVLSDVFVEKGEYFIFRIPLLKNVLFKERGNIYKEIQEFNNFVPIVNAIKANPKELYKVPYFDLHKVYNQLERTNLIDTVVNELKIEKSSLIIVKDGLKSNNKQFDKIIALFVDRLNCKYEKRKFFYLINELKDFPLRVEEFKIYFSIEKDYGLVSSQFNGEKVTLIININSIETQNKFHKRTLDKSDKFIAPKSNEITKLFLEPNPKELLLDILSRHLSLDNISPYQVTRGVDNASIFFGREKIIKDITQRNPRNYLIVGARRVGKSSLLKALHRTYLKNKMIKPLYFTLADNNLKKKIMDELTPRNKNINSFSDLKLYLKQQDKKYVCLIDEVDDFIEYDKNKNYEFLKSLREMSEEGYITFILAGFWQLYQSKFDHQSPLLNFGDFIEIGELESDACHNLIKKPMSVMNIVFEEDSLINNIVGKMGQKAQLISLVCQELLEDKSMQKISIDGIENALITKKDVERVFQNSKKIRTELVQWVKLEDDKKGELLRKLIMYSMLKNDIFNLEDVQELLKKHDIYIDLMDVEYHLELLVLSFFFRKETYSYSFRIPLQRELLLEDNIEMQIRETVYSLMREGV
jgi:predicted AAA+ superfamily ATPase